MDYTVAAVERALKLLEVVADNPNIGLTEIARLTGLTKTLAFRMATTLELQGYLLKNPISRSYALGYKPLYLSERMQHESPLLRVAEPFLDDLSARTRENVSLTVREGLHTICIGIRQSPQPIRLYAELGRQGPLHVGGGPKLLLAYAPTEVQDEIMSGKLDVFTPETIVDPKRLKALLKRIRDQGYNVSLSVAAPIRDHASRVIASVSVAGPQSRFNKDLEKLYVRMLVDTADDISSRLGWRATPERMDVGA